MSIFSKIALRPPKRSTFNLSYENKLTLNFGDLVPVYLQETLPGDVFRHSHSLFAQFMPLNSQLMQNFDVDVHYFHVPTRLIYEDFEQFLVGGNDGTQTFVPPYFTPKDFKLYAFNGGMVPLPANFNASGTLVDYLGIPSNIALLGDSGSLLKNIHLSLLPFRAYWKVYDDYFRDENFCSETLLSVSGGAASSLEYQQMLILLKRAWKKDYFTSALPWTQKGVEVVLPLGEKAPIKTDAGVAGSAYTSDGNNFDTVDTGSINVSAEIYADLENATAATIDQLRTAEMVQEWLEKNARGGTRYNEQIFSHFGVRTPDSRLDRAEFIGYSSSPVNVGNVFSTNSSNGSNVQAVPVSNANSGQRSNRWKYRVKEHGYIIGIMSVKPRAAYFQGIPKSYIRNDKFDYYWPEFANLGEQSIQDYELYADGNTPVDHVFGYTPRYADLKTRLDEVHGDFRSTLKFYHDAREFAAQPTLGKTFIEVTQAADNLTRIFNNISVNNNKILINMRHDVKALRPMPYFGIPMFKSV
nr:MAG: major capsid protein [Microviridae sp.]